MSTEENKALVRRWVGSFNQGDTAAGAAVDELIAAHYVRHDPNAPEVRGPEAEKQLVTMYLTAFPDLHFTIEDLIAEGDTVVARLQVQGTHKGELLGIPPTDKGVTLTAIEIYRLADGKIVEQWVVVDTLGLLQQLGAIPVPGDGNT